MAADAALDGFSQVVTAEAENIQESNMNLEISIEFFPPQTDEGMEKLRTTVTRLAALKPEFFSVTYGAGGSTRERRDILRRRTCPASAPPAAASAKCWRHSPNAASAASSPCAATCLRAWPTPANSAMPMSL
jgi:hypothetical protein